MAGRRTPHEVGAIIGLHDELYQPIFGAPLVESGAYRLIRHPIYSGLVLAAIGWGLVAGSTLAIAAAGLLFLLFVGKSRREEAGLVAVHPEYRAYQCRTKRPIPWIYWWDRSLAAHTDRSQALGSVPTSCMRLPWGGPARSEHLIRPGRRARKEF